MKNIKSSLVALCTLVGISIANRAHATEPGSTEYGRKIVCLRRPGATAILEEPFLRQATAMQESIDQPVLVEKPVVIKPVIEEIDIAQTDRSELIAQEENVPRTQQMKYP